MRSHAWWVAAAMATAGAAIALATVVSSGVGAAMAVVGAVAAVLLAVTGAAPRGAAVALASLAVACTAAATPTVGSDVGRGLAIAAPPVGVAAVALALGSRSHLAAVLAGLGALLAGPVRALFDDPFLDAECAGCRHSAVAVLADRPTALVVAGVGTVLLAAATAAMIRRSPSPVLVAADAALAVGLLPAFALDPAVIGSAALALALVSALAATVRVAASRRRLAELERGLRSGSTATDLLRHATGDAHLTIDFTGSAAPGEGCVPVVSSGKVVATIRSTAVGPLLPLVEHPAPSLLVALAGERLDVELDARVRELRESRSRVVVRADEERRRLERDLHDGAQQYVLALGFDLRAALAVEADPDRRAVLESCVAETMCALDDLRDIAHGVYPPLLAITGLAPALRALGRRTPVPIELGELPGRLPQSVERVAYLLVSELAHEADGPVDVVGAVEHDCLHLSASCRGPAPSPLLRERIAALDGMITDHRHGDGGLRWELTVPCA